MRFGGSAHARFRRRLAAFRAGGVVNKHVEPVVLQFLLVAVVPAQELIAQAGDLEQAGASARPVWPVHERWPAS